MDLNSGFPLHTVFTIIIPFQFSKHHVDCLAISKQAFQELIHTQDEETLEYLWNAAED